MGGLEEEEEKTSRLEETGRLNIERELLGAVEI